MSESDVHKRAFEFVCRVLQMDRTLLRTRTVNRNAMNQRVSAALSVGANLEEARAAQSRADFHCKIRIALKEARESHDWLRLLAGSGTVPMQRLSSLIEEANELVAILTTMAKKSNPHHPSP